METQVGPILIVTPERDAIVADRETTLDVLVRIQAPDERPAAARERNALNLALVLDRSGSMDGRPLEEAKRSAELVVGSLTPTDRVCVVVYDQRPRVLVPSTRVTDPAAIRSALRRIVSGGNTDLHAGWRSGVEEARPHSAVGALTRVLLLSDGQANAGLTDAAAIAGECGVAAAAGITTSTYGLGHSFNEDLMTRMAQLGEGQAWYGETADDLHEPFAAELELLDALYARNVLLYIAPAAGVAVEMRNSHAAVGAGTWRLPSLALGAESWALLSLRVPRGWASTAPLLRVSAGYQDLRGRQYELTSPPLALPVLRGDAWRALPQDELVARRAAELAAADLQRRAREAVRGGDWPLVDLLLRDARRLAAASPWAGDVVAELEHLAAQRDSIRFMKEAAFATHRMNTRLASKVEDAADYDDPAWMRRKRRQGRAGA